jgi:SpoVK/Ycf46/Vps4 family AAA+-type ATPase/predicted RNA-binding Zn-ribbon protein involved in translation (DUF1610 family)
MSNDKTYRCSNCGAVKSVYTKSGVLSCGYCGSSSVDTKSSAVYEHGTPYQCKKCGTVKSVYSEYGLLYCAYCHQTIFSQTKSDNTIYKQDIKEAKTEIKAIDKLNEFIGLNSIKKEIEEEIKIVQYQKSEGIFEERRKGQSQHLIFLGNPGTGKTEIARIIGEIYKELGVLEKGHFIECSRKDFISGFQGQSDKKTNKRLEEALGGVMFIDEAYSLYQDNDNYSSEAIDTLVKYMEDNRDKFILIVAGYPDKMQNFLKSNPGLESRFRKTIIFPDYTDTELYHIGLKFFKDQKLTLSNSAELGFKKILENKKKTYNARDIRMLVDSTIKCLDLRMASTPKAERISKKDLILDIDLRIEDTTDQFNVSFFKIQIMIALILSDGLLHELEMFFIDQLIKFSTFTEVEKKTLLSQMEDSNIDDSKLITIFNKIEDREEFLLDLEKLATIDGTVNEKESVFINKLRSKRG